ncbi:MAG: hypothetical protein K0S41_1206 [Anaerocolumna sp.]|jgi:hypothetical protein|nr:hypothetical protein [Anaerocolumna sp.]
MGIGLILLAIKLWFIEIFNLNQKTGETLLVISIILNVSAILIFILTKKPKEKSRL